MGLRQWIAGIIDPQHTKASATTRAILLPVAGSTRVDPPKDYATYANDGYGRNTPAFACIREIAMACAGISWLVYSGSGDERKPVPAHPLLTLLKRPNPYMAGARLMENIVGALMISGNAYIEALPAEGLPKELFPLRPDRMTVIPGDAQDPIRGYKYTVSGVDVRFDAPQILHLRTYNPTDDWYGMSPLQAAAYAVDSDNEATKWNLNLLKNGARPSGLMTSDEKLTDEQYDRLRGQVETLYVGAANTGRPMLLENGLTWQQISLSAADLDWLEGRKMAQRDICAAFNVPPELIGDSANKTYSNYQEARVAFYQETVLPLMDWIRDELNNWLTPRFGDNVALDYDKEGIEALQDDRNQLWERAQQAEWLTINEKRQMVGLPPIDGGDALLVPATLVPLEALSGTGANMPL